MHSCMRKWTTCPILLCFCYVFVLFLYRFGHIVVDLIIRVSSHAPGETMLYQKADNGKLSGRADGNVYMRNGRVRGMTVPSLVRNAYTSTARTNLGGMSAAWNALTDDQRNTWLSAGNVFTSDRFGQQKLVKGKELFVMCNTNLLNAGSATITTFLPDAIPARALTSLSGAAAVVALANDLTFTNTPLTAIEVGLVFATAPQRSGVYRPTQSKYRLIGRIPLSTASPFSIYTMYNAKFGVPTAGVKLFVRVTVISKANGLASAASDCNYIVAA